ncbi:MAG: glycine oxidase ThiO [Candidatus Rokubacteria bacterium]|nr:glycine oxidase ThiO [Candidatus Rokubacteria bacterium]
MPPSVLVVGGGIIGCATAYMLAKGGCRVTVLERDTPGSEASGAAAGLLAPLGESREPGPFQRLAVESWRLYPAVVAELQGATGMDVEHMTAGTLYPLVGDAEVEAARDRTTWPVAREFDVELLEGAAVREREPALDAGIEAALLVGGDHWVNNERLIAAYAQAAAAGGVVIRSGIEVSEILVEGSRARGVVAGGARLGADAVLLAAGAWSGQLSLPRGPGSPGDALPVTPVRGQILSVSNSPALLGHAVHGRSVYLAPRPSGECLVGATVEHVGFAREVTDEALEHLIDEAVALVPAAGERPLLRSWCGFRPWAPDSLPILGPWPGVEGLFVATAHFRNGILLAPITAQLVSECVLTGRVPALLLPFLPDRFFHPGR